ncbi:DUF3168 domain-containing protein [Sphingomonas sp. KR1UV-12]|uniref:DUF3168 domain-containing protein n=1 Tax=Sphingomonas aurea TaxID=3063994 RepID=A0ABT9ELF2_9SPHN|nr:DUF3168 domain-containing protein [Sphingomonas sp. KR1UV-12]MDP1027789.1 DUF3168 domain-containing protein [Sphingomonas sp. KR1UV-12]
MSAREQSMGVSAREVLVAAVAARLKPLPLTVFDAAPVRGSVPHAVVEEPVLTDWSATGFRGCEGRLVVTLHDEGERPVRLRGLLASVEDAVPGIAPVLGRGWRVAQLRLARSRLAMVAAGRWRGTAEFVVRMYREDA